MTDWKRGLRAAATEGNAAGLRALLADVPEGETVDSDLGGGRTALILASHWGHLTACEFLLQCGADPDRRDAQGASARLFARELTEAGGAPSEAAGRLFDAYRPADPSAVPTLQEFEVEIAEKPYGASQPVRDGFMASANAHIRSALGCAPRWKSDATGGRIWVTWSECAALRDGFDKAEDSFSQFRVRFTVREVYVGGGRAERVVDLEGVGAQ